MNDDKQPHLFTVSELIEILRTFPGDLPVLTSGYDSGFDNIYHPIVTEVRYEPENWYKDGAFQNSTEDDENKFFAVVLPRANPDD